MDKSLLMVTKSKGIRTKFDKLNNTAMNNEFKIPSKYLIDFDSLKVGDRVWSLMFGYASVRVISEGNLPICVGETWYSKDGKYLLKDKYPSLFRSNPFEDLRDEFFKDTLMEVRDEDDEPWKKRVIFGKRNEKWIGWAEVETLKEAQLMNIAVSWNQSRPIPPPSEELAHLTLKDISEGKGKGVPAHLIRIKE